MTPSHAWRSEEGERSELPQSLEAEQSLLGALIYDNAAAERLPDGLVGDHFYEPAHGRLFDAIATFIRQGRLAEPISLVERFKTDPGFADLGGPVRYIADLVDHAPPAAYARDHAETIIDLARRRSIIGLSGDLAKSAREDRETPALEQIEQAEARLYDLAERGAVNSKGPQDFASTLADSLEVISAAMERDGGLSGISTGLIDLDRKLGGLHASDLLIIAGRPSMGKTALATNIAFNIARNYAWTEENGERKTTRGGRVLFFSLEMSKGQLGMRLLADASGISSDRLRKGQLDAGDFARIRDAAIEIQEAPFYIDDTGGLSLAKLVARARRHKRRHGLDLIVIDYLQLITGTGKNGQGRVQEVTEITVGLKALAKELDVPVVALSQLSRQVEQREDKRPQLSDLRESGSIEQDADAVMFVYRESYYLGRAEPKPDTPEHLTWTDQMSKCQGLAELIIGKQRHGPIGTVQLAFDENTTRFSNLAREEHTAARYPYGDD